MIFGAYGNLGKGKTLSTVVLGAIIKSEMPKSHVVMSNFSTDIADFQVTSVTELNQYSKKYSGIQLLDELWAWADSRNSNENDQINDMILNSRKRDWIIIYTTQKAHQIDKRIRENTDIALIPVHDPGVVNDTLTIYMVCTNSMKVVNTVKVVVDDFYDLYDTDEEVAVKTKETEYDDIRKKYIEDVKSGDISKKNVLQSKIYMENPHISKSDSKMLTNIIFHEAKEK